jgi:hypothetical protein
VGGELAGMERANPAQSINSVNSATTATNELAVFGSSPTTRLLRLFYDHALLASETCHHGLGAIPFSKNSRMLAAPGWTSVSGFH